MAEQLRAVTFDLDAATLISFREALPGWKIEVTRGATAASIAHNWNPGAADLLVVNASEAVEETLGLCWFLVRCGDFSTDSRGETAATLGLPSGRQDSLGAMDAPLLVLVPSGQERLVGAALEAGAAGCLVLPVRTKQVASMLARLRLHNQPGRHTLNLHRAQREDRWRDDGGQG
jgi:hypothetical protein